MTTNSYLPNCDSTGHNSECDVVTTNFYLSNCGGTFDSISAEVSLVPSGQCVVIREFFFFFLCY